MLLKRKAQALISLRGEVKRRRSGKQGRMKVLPKAILKWEDMKNGLSKKFHIPSKATK